MRPRPAAALAPLLVLMITVATAASPQNDAGSGGDAGDTESTATPLPGYGEYSGHLPKYDVDQYALVAPRDEPACIRQTTTSAHPHFVQLSVIDAAGERQRLWTYQAAGASASGAIAVNDVSTVTYGIYPGSLRDPGTGAYTFGLTSTLAPGMLAGDAGTSWDAGETPSMALPLSGPCTVGAFQTPLDKTDVYSFVVPRPGFYTYSLGAKDPTITYAFAHGAPISPGESRTIYLNEAGTYHAHVTRATDAIDVTYLLALSEPPPCSPNC